MSPTDIIVLIAGSVLIAGLIVAGVALKRRANASRKPAAPGSRRAAQEAAKPSFGLFGAVTSTISIIPDVEKGRRDGRQSDTDEQSEPKPGEGSGPQAS